MSFWMRRNFFPAFDVNNSRSRRHHHQFKAIDDRTKAEIWKKPAQENNKTSRNKNDLIRSKKRWNNSGKISIKLVMKTKMGKILRVVVASLLDHQRAVLSVKVFAFRMKWLSGRNERCSRRSTFWGDSVTPTGEPTSIPPPAVHYLTSRSCNLLVIDCYTNHAPPKESEWRKKHFAYLSSIMIVVWATATE